MVTPQNDDAQEIPVEKTAASKIVPGEEHSYLINTVYKDDTIIAKLELRTSTSTLDITTISTSEQWAKIRVSLEKKTYSNLEDIQKDILKGDKNYVFGPKGIVDEN